MDNAMSAKQIVAAVRQETVGVEQISTAMGEINSVTSQFVSASRQTTAAADELTDQAAQLQMMVRQFKVNDAGFDFALARAVHHAWKVRIRAFLDGRESLSKEEAVSHHHCELGKWLDNEGRAKYGNIPEMAKIDEPHEKLHPLIKEIIALKSEGRHEEAENCFAELEQQSERIIGLLGEIEQQATR